MRLALLSVALLLSACGQKASPAAPPAPPPEPSATLETTWLVPGQAPQTTQTAFTSMAKCQAARQAALDGGEQTRAAIAQQNAAGRAQVKQELAQDQAQLGGVGIVSPGPAQIERLKGQPLPTVSAVCLQQ